MMKKHDPRLLSRQDFKKLVFERDGHACRRCLSTSNLDAHHIYERRLWDDGGYYLLNGVALCEICHPLAEDTTISVEELHRLIGAVDPPRPDQLTCDGVYDKWGNCILPDGRRTRGPLYDRVKELLNHVEFEKIVKYPRTMHLPWSPGRTIDDRVISTLEHLEGRCIVVTEKMDGENTTMYRDGIHARSTVNLGSHPTRTWVKTLHAEVAHDIPEGWRVCGENLQGVHSVRYDSLESYFLAFSIWDSNNTCLSWPDTVEWCGLLGIKTVPVIFEGTFEDFQIARAKKNFVRDGSEGYVVRPHDSFQANEFRKLVAKYVRAGHVTTGTHWKFSKPEFNTLKRIDETPDGNL